jgi:hypothetical protein
LPWCRLVLPLTAINGLASTQVNTVAATATASHLAAHHGLADANKRSWVAAAEPSLTAHFAAAPRLGTPSFASTADT